jgi:hypothetical protein
MTPTTKHAAGPQAIETSTGVGAFMLTLCRLEAPVSIRPPQNPHLARFKFFMSRSRLADGQQHLYLHMGYFPTLEQAGKWMQVMRARYPQAIATRTPTGLLPRAPQPPVLHGIPPAEANTLTDTQVLQILETRRIQPDQPGRRPPERPEISLLRPDDTNTRRALKEAVVQGAPISFVVQLCRSAGPIQLGSVPSLDIFRAYTLYLAEGTHEDRSWYALRLGFFNDAVSAKQVAYYARTHFASVAVVPINDAERASAGKKPITLALLAKPADRSIDEILAVDQANTAPAEKSRDPVPRQPSSAPSPPRSPQSRATASPKARSKNDLEQTLELLAASELWSNTDSDSLTATGVRHLKVEVKKR